MESAALPTFSAPSERADLQAVRAAHERLLADPLAMKLLAALPDPVMVVNAERQVVACNHRLWEALGLGDPESMLGLRPGELIHCVHAAESPGGCGASEACANCGAVHAVLECLAERRPVAREGRLRTTNAAEGGAMDLCIRAVPLRIEDTDLVVVSLRDISAEKRREVLERVFFHDVANTAMGIVSVAELMGREGPGGKTDEEYREDLRRLSRQILEEISAQSQLLAAEHGDLVVHRKAVTASEILEAVVAFYRNQPLAQDRELRIAAAPETSLCTDVTLLRRTLGNLVKNALEATPPGGTVSLGAEDQGEAVAFWVHNPGVIPIEVQQQLFHRSFSTRRGPGRGIGLHSVKLFAERYLNGRVAFTSSEPEGTTFTVTLPRDPSDRNLPAG